MIYLVNKYGFGPVGHYWTCDYNLRLSMRELNISYTYLNPTADLAFLEDGIDNSQNFLYHNINQSEFNIENLISLINERDKLNPLEKKAILFSWLPMFDETELKLLQGLDKKIGIAAITSRTSDSVLGNPTINRFYGQENFRNYSSNSFLWVWERVPTHTDELDRIFQLPDYIASLPAEEKRDWNQISFFGLLGGHRGMAEILILALFNPSLKVRIKGYSFSAARCWRPFKIKAFRYSSWKTKPWFSLPFTFFSLFISLFRFLPNVEFSRVPFETESDLSEAISKSGTLFMCLKYPFASGVVMKSLYSGIPVIWNIPLGQAREVLEKSYPIGQFKYWEIFVPGRFTKKLKSIRGTHSHAPYSWEDYKKEINRLRTIST